jgi:hypothetical protein
MHGMAGGAHSPRSGEVAAGSPARELPQRAVIDAGRLAQRHRLSRSLGMAQLIERDEVPARQMWPNDVE